MTMLQNFEGPNHLGLGATLKEKHGRRWLNDCLGGPVKLEGCGRPECLSLEE